MLWTPSSVAFGVRHKRIFGFLSRAGDVIDNILALDGTGVFPPKCFKRIGWPNQVTARVQNEDETFVVECNIDGLVLTVDLEETQLTREKAKIAFGKLAGIVLRVTGGDKTVNRLGIVDNYILPQNFPGKAAVTSLTRLEGIGDPADFWFRGSFRTPTEKGLVQGSMNDWRNTIIQIGTVKKEESTQPSDELRVSIDCQIYFDPERSLSEQLINDHYQDFLIRIQKLQGSQMAGLAPSKAIE